MSESVPVNLYTLEKTLLGEMVENRRLTAEARGITHDVRHLIFRYREPFRYLPGQSVGILVPGTDPRTGKPHKLRLYSVASESRGDFSDGASVSLCVVRHFWDHPKTGEKNIPGVASRYLCDLNLGDPVKMTGAVGRHFLLPPDVLNRDLIFVATGTGIAPYRGMLKEMFDRGFMGHVWLYFGVQYRDTVLYDGEFETYRKFKNFSYIKALSREDTNPVPDLVPTRENRTYVQVKMYQDRKLLAEALSKPDSMIFLCGLKGMEQGIFPVLEKMGSEMGMKESLVAKLKAEQRLKIEVY